MEVYCGEEAIKYLIDKINILKYEEYKWKNVVANTYEYTNKFSTTLRKNEVTLYVDNKLALIISGGFWSKYEMLYDINDENYKTKTIISVLLSAFNELVSYKDSEERIKNAAKWADFIDKLKFCNISIGWI